MQFSTVVCGCVLVAMLALPFVRNGSHKETAVYLVVGWWIAWDRDSLQLCSCAVLIKFTPMYVYKGHTTTTILCAASAFTTQNGPGSRFWFFLPHRHTAHREHEVKRTTVWEGWNSQGMARMKPSIKQLCIVSFSIVTRAFEWRKARRMQFENGMSMLIDGAAVLEKQQLASRGKRSMRRNSLYTDKKQKEIGNRSS